jgi:hypothetical protein
MPNPVPKNGDPPAVVTTEPVSPVPRATTTRQENGSLFSPDGVLVDTALGTTASPGERGDHEDPPTAFLRDLTRGASSGGDSAPDGASARPSAKKK